MDSRYLLEALSVCDEDKVKFEFGDNGLSHALSQDNIDSEGITNAIESCPTSAISIEEKN